MAVLGLHRSGCARVFVGQSGDSASSDSGPFGGSDLLLLVPSTRVVRRSHARRDAVPAKLVGIVDRLQLAAAQVQRARMAVVPHAWRRLNDGLWEDPKTGLATISLVVGIASGVLGLVLIPFS